MIERPNLQGERSTEIVLKSNRIFVDIPFSQSVPIVGYLGPEGTYSQEALERLVLSKRTDAPIDRISDIARRLKHGEINLGLFPIENSSEGNVIESLRCIIKLNEQDNILAEEILPIHHFLLGEMSSGGNPVIHSHPQAIGQCELYLEKNYPNAEIVAEASTAQAVRIACEKRNMAIGSRLAGLRYKLPVLAENIEDQQGNTTRFWLIGKGETEPSGDDRTILLFVLENKVGYLRRCLNVFADRGINITKIDSFPYDQLDEYYFLLALDGHKKDSETKEALEEFGTTCKALRILGSFKKEHPPKDYSQPGSLM